MDFSSICRTCLGTKYLSPIFKGEDDHDRFSAKVLITTGLQVKINDGLPQQMCRTCIQLIKDTLKFQQLCKKTEIQLLSIKNNLGQYEHNLQSVVTQKSNKRKKSTEIKNSRNVITTKIESDFNIPLLQQKLNFARHKHIEIDTEFVKIDETEDESDNELVKNEENDENNHQIHNELIDNTKIGDNGQEVVNQFGNDEKIEENYQKYNEKNDYNNLEILEYEADESTFETEFLDLDFDSDPEKHLSIQMETPKYEIGTPINDMEILNNDMAIPNNDMEIPNNEMGIYNNDTEISKYEPGDPKYNINIPNNMKNTNYNNYQINYTKVKKINTKNRRKKPNKNSLLKPIEIKDTQIDSNNLNSFKVKENSDVENLLFIIKDENRVACKLCQKDLSRRSIGIHIANSHPGADTRKVKCELCDIYVLKERLLRHKNVMHGLDCFRCGYCKTVFESKEYLIDHVSTCTAKKRKRKSVSDKRKELIVECDVCSKSMLKSSLKMHKGIKHAGMGPVCEHCGNRFGNKYRLGEHLRAKHGYEKFKCGACDFLSASSMAMKNHERRHRGEKPYVCEQCGAKFHAPSLLAQHKHSHRTEKIMKCDQCPAAFKANNTLHMHKMTCHNNKTYQCPMCPRTYNSRHYAVKHLRNVHRHTGTVGPLVVGPKMTSGAENDTGDKKLQRGQNMTSEAENDTGDKNLPRGQKMTPGAGNAPCVMSIRTEPQECDTKYNAT